MRLSLLVRRVILALTVIYYAVSGTLVADPIQIDVKTGTDVKAATDKNKQYELNIIGDVTVKATELNSVWGTYDELFCNSDYTISSVDGQSSLHFSGKSRTGLEKLFYGGNVTISNLEDVSISDHYNMASTPDYEYGTWSQPWNYTARESGALINSTVVVKDLGGSFTIQNNSTESSHWAISQGDATVNGGLLNIYGSFINISGGVNITNNYVKEAPTISRLIGKYVDREFYVYGGMGNGANLQFMENRTGIHIDGNYVYQEFFRGTEGQGYGGAFYLSGADENIFSGNAGLLSVSDNYLHMATIAQGGAFYLHPKCGLTITGQKDDTENQIAAHVLFSGNHLDIKNIRGIERWEMAADGGAVYLGSSSVFTISDNAGVVEFSDNRIFADASEVGNDDDMECTARGGAVYLGDSAEFQITGNETVLFNGNTVEMDYPEQDETTRWAAGGAIFAEKNSAIEFSNNSNQVIFFHNSALGIAESIEGGAIALYHGSTLTFKNNVPDASTSKPGVLFEGNTAEEGGAIYMGADTLLSLEQNQWVEFRDNQAVYGGALYARGNTGLQMNDNVVFTGNTAEVGGALYVNGELTINGELLSLEFDGNKADYAGAIAVALESSLVISGNKVDILFQNNESVYGGGAIYSYSDFTFADNQSGQICFRDNTDSTHGGAIYVAGKAEFSRNGTAILFEDNSSQLGGAICLEDALLFSDNRGAISFADNRSATQGGAIASVSTVTFDSNTGLISFVDNEAQSGAAISAAGLDVYSNSGAAKFMFNTSQAGAGAVYATVVNFLDNEAAIVFAGNRGVYGGAVAGSELNFSNNKAAVAFIANVARGDDGASTDTFGAGGALYVSPDSTTSSGIVSLSGNEGRLLFLANRAENVGAMGGAIYATDSTLSISDNLGKIQFAANESADSGGAIALQCSDLCIQNNQNVEFRNNTATEKGGAIAALAGTSVQIHDNKEVLFSGNSAAYGSAIYAEGGLSIRNNESVIFSNQAGSAIHLAIDTSNIDSNQAHLSLSAAAGKSILFDGTGIRTERTKGSSNILIDLNADYGDNGIYQAGDIVFRGADSKSNLFSAAVTHHRGNFLLEDKSQMYVDGRFTNQANIALRDGAQFSVSTYTGETNSTLQVNDSSVLAQTLSLTYASHARFENSEFGKLPGAVNRGVISVDSYSVLTLAGGNTFEGKITLLNGGSLSLSGHNVLNGNLHAGQTGHLEFSISDDANILFSSRSAADVSQLRAQTMTWDNLRELSDKWHHEVELNISSNAAGGTYVLLSLENAISETSWADNWTTPKNVYWLDANTLVYKHEIDDLVWMNRQETSLWNFSDTNWQKMKDGSPAGVDVCYNNGGRVYFTDDCQDSNTVVLTEDVFMEQMTVSADRDYEFVSIGGKITHDTVLVKEGSGKLSINFNNDFVGGVELKEGTIHVGADYALGKGKLVTKEGTVLEIGSGVHAMIEHGSSTVSGAIALADDAVIEFGGNFLASGPQSLSGNGKLILSARGAGLSVLGAYEGNADFEVTGANAELRFYKSADLGEGSSIKLRNGAGFFMYNAPLSLTGTVIDAAGVANVLSASPGLSIGSSSTALHFDISDDNLYANESTANAILKVEGVVQHQGYTLHVDAAGLEYGETYVLMTCDSSFAGEGINVTGAATSTDLQWLNNNTTLVYTHNAKEYVWMNDTGSGEWNKHDANWHYANSDAAVIYGDGVNVVFNDACKDAAAVTLVQDAAPESVFVDAERDYTITTDGGKITGATGITKNGSGTLELRLDNDFTGDVMLNEGTLVAAADHALGNGLLTVNNGATLEIAGLGTQVTTTGSSIVGALKVNHGAGLSVESPTLFSATVLQVDGALRLATAAQDAHADSLSGAGQMYVSGGGSVSLGSLSADSGAFSGTLSVTGAHVTLQNAREIKNATIALHGEESTLALHSTDNTSSFIQQASLSMENGAYVQLPGVTDTEKGTLHLQGATLSVSGSGNVVDGHLKFSMHESKPVTLNFTLTGEETAPLLHADSLDWQKGVKATINIDFIGDIVSGRYVLLDLDASMPANNVTEMPDCWSAAFVSVTGDASFADLEWVCKGDALFGQLVLDAAPINGLVWNNASGSQRWNYTDANWRNGTGDDVSYFNDKTIYFLDYKGPERLIPLDNVKDYTVYLDPSNPADPNVFRPQEIIVDTEKRYEFYEVQYAEAQSGRIEGAELIKKGNGTLALYADNNVFSGIQLLEGTLVVGFDGSIDIEPGETGTGCFTAAVGTNLELVNRACVDIKTDGSSIRGGVSVDSTSELIYSAPRGYWAAITHVDGDLTFSGDFRSSKNDVNSVSAGELSGSGSVNLVAARAGALAYFSLNNGFTGDLNADNAGTLMFGEGGYASELGYLSAKNGAQIIFRNQNVSLTAASGVSLQQGGLLEADTLNIASGAALEATGAHNVLQTNGILLENGFVSLQFGADNIYTEGSNNAVLTVNGKWIVAGNNTFTFTNTEGIEADATYYLLSVENGFDISKWNTESTTVQGVAFSDLKWIDDNTKLIYQHSVQELVWMNSAGTQMWNFQDANWVQENSTTVMLFHNGDSVHFTDASPSSANTVTLDSAVAPKNVYVESDANNFVFTGEGKLTGDLALYKTGDSTLTIKTNNDFTGTVQLSEGSLCLHADAALGAAALQTAVGTTLSVGDSADVYLNTADSRINGNVVVDADAELRVGNAVVWDNTHTEVNGTLVFEGDFSQSTAVSGVVAGTGTIVHAGTVEHVDANVITIHGFETGPQVNFTAENSGIIHFDLADRYFGGGVFTASSGGTFRFDQTVYLHLGNFVLSDGGVIEAPEIIDSITSAYIFGVNNRVETENGMGISTFYLFASQANTYTNSSDVAALQVKGDFYSYSSNYYLTLLEAVSSGTTLLLMNLDTPGSKDPEKLHLPEHCMWIEGDSKLVYVQPSQDLVWMNSSDSGVWNHDDANWQVGEYANAISFTDADRVFFTDACTDASDVQISTAVAPAYIEVNAENRDYVFTGNGKITGETALVKKGAGSLALATDNDFCGGVDLQQGTLRLRADNALGNSALKTESGTTLVVENEADVALDFAAEDTPLKSDIQVDTGASLTLGGNYTASSSVSLAGNGKLRFNAENGQILFSFLSAFGGELSVVAAGSAVSVESGYSGAAALRVVGAESQMSFAGDVLLAQGGSLQVAENAVFAIDSITGSLELASGATLHAGVAAIAAASSLALVDAACPSLAVQHVELCGGSTYVQDGTYFTLTGDADSLAFKGDGVILLKTTLDYTVTEDGLHRFILFDGVEESLTLSDSVAFSIVGYEGLETNVVQVGSAVYLQVVPEPATATLGLLALVALTARRRRK